jgi:tetratricopeptide (TPR) repeat protein
MARPRQACGAINCYQRSIALKPDFFEAHYNLGGAFHECGRFDEAISHYEEALALKPDFIDAHYNFGNLLQEVGQIDAARSSYERAIALRPDFASVHNNLGHEEDFDHDRGRCARRL